MDTVTNSYVEAAQDGTLDLLDGELYREDPYPTYRWLRDNDPVYWDAGNELWGILRYDDIVEIEKNPEHFISSSPEGGYRPKMPADPSMIGMDDPLHQVHRRLVATDRLVTAWPEDV